MASLKLEIKDVVFVKPSKPTPFSSISLSTIDNRAELNTLCQTIHVYQSPNNNDSPHSQLDPALMIKEALSKTLFYYHPLAGKLVKHVDGKLRIHCNGGGVPFIETIANCKLSSLHYLDGSDSEIAKHLTFDLPNSLDENGYQYPLGFKLTKFQCGGFTIGIGASHVVFDGNGASQFFRAISELASGKTEPSVKPVWERERLIGSITKQPLQIPIDEDSAAISPFLPTKFLMHEYFEVDNESITRLKLTLMNEIINDNNNNDTTMKEEIRFTSFESLGAYVWRSRTRALKLNHDGKTSLAIVIGIGRNLLEPPLPEGYYGNAFIDPKVVLKVRELNEGPLSNVVKIIKETKKNAFTWDCIRKSIDTLETKLDNVGYFQGVGASMVLSNWMHLGLLENLDFGWGEPVNVVPAPCNMFGTVGMCIFSPPSNLDPSMNGGVRILVSLPSEAMPKFREEMEALKLIKP